jgi:hypothetical protein
MKKVNALHFTRAIHCELDHHGSPGDTVDRILGISKRQNPDWHVVTMIRRL